MATVWLSHRAEDRGPLDPGGFFCEWYAHAVELRRRRFHSYRDALAFADRKAGKRGAIVDSTPPDLRRR